MKTKNRLLYFFILSLFFILLSEHVLAYIFTLLSTMLGFTKTEIGLLLGIVGVLHLGFNAYLPIFFRRLNWRYLLLLSSALGCVVPALLFASAKTESFLILFIATFIWYIYFEIVVFAQELFVIENDKEKVFSKDWGTIFTFIRVAFILSPIIVSPFIPLGAIPIILLLGTLSLLSLVITIFTIFLNKRNPLEVSPPLASEVFNFKNALKNYKILLPPILSVLIVYVLTYFIDEMFNNLGALFGLELTLSKGYEWVVVVGYNAPMFLGPIFLSKVPIKQRKKVWTLIFLSLGGLTLSLIFFFSNPIPILGIIAASAMLFSFTSPLNEAVFSDLIARSDQGRTYIFSWMRISAGLGFVISPFTVLIASDFLSYKSVFSLAGVFILFSAIILLFFTPKKIKIPNKKLSV